MKCANTASGFFPGRAVLTEWLSRTATHFNRLNTSWAAGLGPRVCEVNYRSGSIAMAFLCAWPGASYVGLDFGNASRLQGLVGRTARRRSGRDVLRPILYLSCG